MPRTRSLVTGATGYVGGRLVPEETDDATFLRLRAELLLPGLAWLEMQVGSNDAGTTTFHHRALFHPKGLLGRLYWWSILPFHGIVFGSMQRNIAKAAEQLENSSAPQR